MLNQPFFIIGTQRGGTTLLRMMLNMHSKLAIPPESHFLMPLFNEFSPDTVLDSESLDKALTIIYDHPRFTTWSVTQNDLKKLKCEITFPLYLSDLVDRIFKLQISPSGKHRWGEKTPEYVNIIPELIALFPSATFIMLTRDGRDVSISLKKRGWQGASVLQRANYWKGCIKNMNELRASNQVMFIKYEDLVLNTTNVLKQLCSRLNVSYEEEMLDFNLSYASNITETEKKIGVHKKLSRKPTKNDVSKWFTEASKFEVWTFESIAYSQMIDIGYDLVYFSPANFGHQLLKCLYIVLGNLISMLDFIYHKFFPSSLQKAFRNNYLYLKVKKVIKSL